MSRSTRVAPVILLIIGLPFLFARLYLPLLDPDEGLYASIAQEMLSRGDWVIPHVNGLPYLEKPLLYFWLYGGRAGLLAGLALATVVGNALYVRKASTDQLFVFCFMPTSSGKLGPRLR